MRIPLWARRIARRMRSRPTELSFPGWSDGLAAMPHRRMLAPLLAEAQQTAGRMESLSLLVVNLDRFKMVNDLCGHAAGDEVLTEVTGRCRALADKAAVIIHLGGDEFACLLKHSGDSDVATAFAQEMLDLIARPISVGHHIISVTASIGITTDHDLTQSADEMLRAASIAMSHAKRAGGASQRTFAPEMFTDLRDRAELEHDLRSGIMRGELMPFYQPIVDLGSGALIGFESLARWQHPHRGLLMPDLFIPVAEDLGLINDLCFSLLRQACRASRDWPPHFTLSINMSSSQICDPDVPPRLLQILFACGLQPGRLVVEITESAMVHNVTAARATIESLSNAGVQIALDDFGTGFASLNQLCELQMDKIKIDRQITQSLDSVAGRKLVKAVLDLGCSLDMPVTAEGIETQTQAQMLAELGCAYGQGYLFGRPAPAHATLALIRDMQHSALDERGLRAV